jgi:hypothetical protein
MQKISIDNATAILECGVWKSTDTKLQNMLNSMMSFEEKTDRRLEKSTAMRLAKIFDGYYCREEETNSIPLENNTNNNTPSECTTTRCTCGCRKQVTE